MKTVTAKYEAPQWMVDGMTTAKSLRSCTTKVEAQNLFELHYATGQLTLTEAQDFLSLEDCGKGTFKDDRGVAWYLDGDTIYRIAETPFEVEASLKVTAEEELPVDNTPKIDRAKLRQAVEEFLVAAGTQERAELLDTYVDLIKPRFISDLGGMTEKELESQRPAVFSYYFRIKEDKQEANK